MLAFRLVPVLCLLTAPAMAEGLPGGANSLRETHGDWAVNCAINQGETAPVCAISQEQVDRTTRQRVVAVELLPTAAGLAGTLILPFGLALSAGAILTVDNAEPQPAMPFRTCVPGGCLVSLGFSFEAVGMLRDATAIKVETQSDGGAPAVFSISLDGFASAVDRLMELTGTLTP
jgi:invasion protein IalB